MARHVLCDLSEVPEGSCRAFNVDGKRIAVYNVGGAFYATQNHCTHKGAQLVKGTLEGTVIECSQHGWKFDVTSGACLSPRHGRKLRSFAVVVEESSLLIDLDGGGDGDGAGAAPASAKPAPAGDELEFHPVANYEDLEDEDVIGVTVGGEDIAIYRIDGEVYATHGLCTHESVKLCDGLIEGELIECPLHNACFEIKTGKAVNPPAEIDLKIYPVKRKGDTIYVGIHTG